MASVSPLFLSLFLLFLLPLSSSKTPSSPLSPRASAVRYWNEKVTSPQPSFFTSKLSPLSPIQLTTFSSLSPPQLSSKLSSFCSQANLLCSPSILITPSLPSHELGFKYYGGVPSEAKKAQGSSHELGFKYYGGVPSEAKKGSAHELGFKYYGGVPLSTMEEYLPRRRRGLPTSSALSTMEEYLPRPRRHKGLPTSSALSTMEEYLPRPRRHKGLPTSSALSTMEEYLPRPRRHKGLPTSSALSTMEEYLPRPRRRYGGVPSKAKKAQGSAHELGFKYYGGVPSEAKKAQGSAHELGFKYYGGVPSEAMQEEGFGGVRVVEPGRFFRESSLKKGTVMPMPDIASKVRGRSFLPRSIVHNIPFSASKVRDIFRMPEDTALGKAIGDTIALCELPASKLEIKRCPTSAEELIDFATSVLGPNIVVRSTDSTHGSAAKITLGQVKRLNGTQSVSCHEMVFPYLTYLCHSVPKVRMYEAEILPINSQNTINNAIAICHVDTSNWSAAHPAFTALGPGPGSIEVCHWIFVGDMIWAQV